MNHLSQWNHPEDLHDIRQAFDAWADAVIAGDRARIEPFHDDGFLVTLPDGTLLDKAGHIKLELEAQMRVMQTKALRTRRLGDVVLVWATRHLEGTSAPAVDGTQLAEGWVPDATMQAGFQQADFSVWRRGEAGKLQCLAFELTMLA
ncbi:MULTISPECIES: nuclear transport factor 2 family protein [Pandoraea]|uniref:nuclear transport factor 2 family protein n=1 Tax=Pandoraea TaxID=93217 RepID=UPI001F5DD3B3|nr:MULTISPECIES: nuclear transport factor 2 family protein [Pandoraea]MCI3203525.1 hypothetical protein [Pandoraea sp. LA3]MDN4581551.1 hypothetical protein [Pandoraea capi]